MRCLLPLLLAIWLSPVAAQQSPSTDWQARCTLNGQAFSLRFHTDSPDVTDDNMQVTLTLDAGQPVILPLPPAWYHPLALTGDIINLCDRIVATPAGSQQVLLWLATDDRPYFPQLMLVLIDLRHGRIQTQHPKLGAIKSSEDDAHLVIRRQGHGYQTRIVREVLTGTNDDTAYNYIEDWLRIGVDKQHIRVGWR